MFKDEFMEADAPNRENFRYSPLTASEKYHLKSGNLSHMSPQEYIEDSQSAISQARVEAGLGSAASTLNQFAPPNERLAFINPVEEAMLKEMGGSGEPAAGGIPSFKKGMASSTPQRNYSPLFSDNRGNFFQREANPNYKALPATLQMFAGGTPPSQYNYSQISTPFQSQNFSGRRYGKAQRYNPGPGIPSFDPENPQDDALPKNKSLNQKAKDLNKVAPEGERLAYINPAEEELLKKFGGSGEPAAGGIPSFKKGDVAAPPPRNYGKETRDTLQAQVDLAPQLFAKESMYRPQYADLERGMMLEQMGIDPSKGLLQAYEEDFAPSMVRQKAATVKGDINMLREYGPELLEAQRAADPLADSLRQGIMDTAAEDLAAGMGLTETEQRDLDQQVLAGAADRGMEGQASTFGDMIGQRLSANRGIKQQRLSNAANAFQLGASDPLFALTGRAATTPNQAMAQFGSGNFALDSSPGLFNPESQYAGNLATQNFQGQMDARTATAANQAGMFGGLLGGLGSAAGGIFSGGFARGGAFT